MRDLTLLGRTEIAPHPTALPLPSTKITFHPVITHWLAVTPRYNAVAGCQASSQSGGGVKPRGEEAGGSGHRYSALDGCRTLGSDALVGCHTTARVVDVNSSGGGEGGGDVLVEGGLRWPARGAFQLLSVVAVVVEAVAVVVVAAAGGDWPGASQGGRRPSSSTRPLPSLPPASRRQAAHRPHAPSLTLRHAHPPHSNPPTRAAVKRPARSGNLTAPLAPCRPPPTAMTTLLSLRLHLNTPASPQPAATLV
ncbi:hypothetical protein E2C01_035751 [Portunus trituberculatus]|uniref:Uncharacterized protein n=1 Tax=Portunus trituberculatus TaxID=210409 RepID=A0A5B7FA09_PORTR|nr:hypothetical protein [Portunus trituberculatus]